MKNMKKLTTLISAVILSSAVCAINANAEQIDYDEATAIQMFDEYMETDYAQLGGLGDVNHDGFIDANDATMVLEYYAYCSVTGTEHDNSVFYTYTEEQTDDIYAYGDVNKDGCVNPIDATWIAIKYAENSTL